MESNQNQLTNKIAALEALVKSMTGQPTSKSEKGSCSGKRIVVEDATVEDEDDVKHSDKKKKVNPILVLFIALFYLCDPLLTKTKSSHFLSI